jgi:hypothetical protein
MANTIYTRALAQATALHGSTRAIAHELRVPENTLSRWMAGRAQMPLAAFHRLIELLTRHEKAASAAPVMPLAGEAEKLKLTLGELAARCQACENEEFLSGAPLDDLQMISVLACTSCKKAATYGELIARLATQALRTARVPPRPSPRAPEHAP